MNITEPLERGELDHRFDLTFEQHRQNNDVQRRRLAQAGIDLDVTGRYIDQQYSVSFESALSDQPFSGPEAIRDILALAVGVAGQ